MAMAKDPKTGLTQQQEHFARLIALEEKNQTEAYKIVYPASLKWSDEAVYARSSALAHSDKVLIRTQALKAQVNEKAVEKKLFTIEEAIEKLQYAYSVAKTKEEAQNLIKATEALAKLTGVYEEKPSIVVNVGVALKSLTEV